MALLVASGIASSDHNKRQGRRANAQKTLVLSKSDLLLASHFRRLIAGRGITGPQHLFVPTCVSSEERGWNRAEGRP